MKRFIFGLIAALLALPALAQTPTQFNNIQVNSQTDLRGNVLNGTGTLTFADTVSVTGKLTTATSTTLAAGLNLPAGAAPTSPVNGDVWTTTSGLFAQINGSTQGPFAAASAGAALTKTDDTNVTLTLGGSPTTALLNAASLTLGWTGNLSVARGGSGAGTLTGLLQGNGTSAFTTVANSSTTGQVLRVTGAAAYAFGALDLANASAITGTLPVANGGTNLTSASDDNIPVGNGTTWQSKTVPDCTDTGGNHINYTQSTNAFSCGTSGGGGGSPGGSNTQVQFNDSSAFGGDAGLVYDKSGNILTTEHAVLSASGGEYLLLTDTAQGADAKNTLVRTGTGGRYLVQTSADATPSTPAKNVFEATRTGSAVATVALGNSTDAPTFTVNAVDLTPHETLLFPTFTGCTSDPGVFIYYYQIGHLVTLVFKNTNCTSNATTSATNAIIPVIARPSTNQDVCGVQNVLDNGVQPTTVGCARIVTDGTVLFYKDASEPNWTNSGTKAFNGTLSYYTNN